MKEEASWIRLLNIYYERAAYLLQVGTIYCWRDGKKEKVTKLVGHAPVVFLHQCCY